jgi:cytochrome c oxidase cbb3-type subunit 3
MFKRVVNGLEALTLLAVVVFVVMLFANEPGSSGDSSKAGGGPGAEVYAARCAGCHGSDGGGGVGPQLSDGEVVDAFPDVADEVAVVTDGRGRMPAFGDRLSPAEIDQVVAYTRTL